jgi:hypothetical protein
LAILTGAIAVLGELARLGTRNAQIARDTARAQLLCETALAEITSGITAPETVQAAPCVQDFDISGASWLYSVDVQPLDLQGLLAVQVTVQKDVPSAARPVKVSLVRWMIDPTGSSLQSSTSQSSQSSTSSSQSSTSSSTGSGG